MMKSNKYAKKSSSKKRILLVVLAVALAWTAVLSAGFWFFVVRNIAEEVTVEAGCETVDPNGFRIRQWNIPVEFVTDIEAIDLNMPGDYPVQLLYLDRIHDSVLRIRDTIPPKAELLDVTTLSIRIPEPEEFISQIWDVTQVSVSYETLPDMTQPGEQIVSVLLTDGGGNTSLLEATLTVIFDTSAPIVEGVQNMSIYRGQEPDYLDGVTISDDLDEAPVLTVDDSRVDLTQGGNYQVIYTAMDASGNSVHQTATLTVIVDEEAPAILGVQPISLYAGSTVSYRSGIVVRDNIDESPRLSIDSSGVDLTQPGEYQIVFTATDAAGNSSSVTAPVTVKEKTGRYVEESVILDRADQVLAVIIREEMTDREKVETVFRWVTGNFSYYGASDKTDWMQAAYSIMTTRMGDCFNFYAVTKLLLDRLGIPNITVTRCDNPYRATRHYWSLVSIDGGETYYHVDTTPHSNGNYRFCLVTDEYLDYYDTHIFRGYYARDKSLYPATPIKALE